MRDKNIIPLNGTPDAPDTWVYQNADNGIVIRQAVIDSGKRETEPVKIMQISDLHINYFNEKDLQNEELLYTKECRKWLADAESLEAIDKVMACAKDYDQTVVTGDTLDFLSDGGIELMQKHIWDVDPEALIALGGHDITRQMQTGRKDATSLEERHEVLKNAWKHDIFYVSKVLKEKVMIIVLDNGNHCYWDEQAKKLDGDLKLARKKGYVVLVFQHEPICTGKPEDHEKECIREYDGKYRNFYEKCIGFDEPPESATGKVYQLLTGNADVIKGFFCGHNHSMFYTEVKAYFRNEEGRMEETMIPQRIVTPSAYDNCAGHIMSITVR